MRHHRSTRVAVACALLAVPLLSPAAAQSARDVVQAALERYEERMEGVENYTVVQSVMGFQSTVYYERETVDGRPVFVQKSVTGMEATEDSPASPYDMLTALGDRASLEGTETVDGEECHVLAVTDFSGEAFDQYRPAQGEGWTPERMTLWLDPDDAALRKMVVEGTATVEGEERPVTMTALLQDYREVKGVYHPFRMQVRTEGLGAEMTPEERAEMERSLKEMEEKMEQMPAQQREMMERMMGGKLEKMKEMLSSGALDFTVEVEEIRVNEGPPGGG